MNDEIIEAEVISIVPLEVSIASPFRALAVRSGKSDTPEAIFAPAKNPEMRGRRPSGVVFPIEDVPAGAAGVPIDEQPDIAITKRRAKSVAEELTKLPVACHERGGYCHIEVVFPGNRLEFHGRTWFLAVAGLKNYLDKPRRR